jgi:hypothetical protein
MLSKEAPRIAPAAGIERDYEGVNWGDGCAGHVRMHCNGPATVNFPATPFVIGRSAVKFIAVADSPEALDDAWV